MIKKVNFFVTTFALSLSVMFAAFAVAQDEPFDLAKKAFGQKNWNNVVRYSKQVVNEHPEFYWGHYLQGLGHFGLKQYDSAIKALGNALNYAGNNDESFQAKVKLTESYYKKRDYANTLKWIKSAERNKSSKYYKGKVLDSIAGMKGFSYYNTDKWKDAIAAFSPLVSSGKASADVLRAVALSNMNSNNNAEAIRVINQVVRKDPSDMAAHKILIKSYLNGKQWRQADGAVATALQQNDRDWELHYFKGRAQSGLGRLEAAATSLRRSIAISSKDKTRKLLGETYMAQGKYQEAATEFTAGQKSYASDASYYTMIGFSWSEFVPKDAEKYFGKPQARNYMRALENGEEALNHAKTLSGADEQKIADLLAVIANKRERLEKGETITKTFEYRVNPETGEIEKVEIGKKEN